MQKIELLNMLRDYFNDSELRDICFSLDIDYESLPGTSKMDKSRELITHLERHKRIPDLLSICARLRPSVSWHESQLVNETKIQELMDTHAETFFLKHFPESIRGDFESAEEAWLVGFSLVRTIRPYFSTIKRKLENNHIIKVLVVHPDAPAVEAAVQRSFKLTSVERKRREIVDTLGDLCALQEYGSENLHVRTIRFPLEYGAQAMNPETYSGVVYVKLYPFRVEGEKPKFVLRATYGSWYRVFVEELKALWNAGAEWNCN